MSSSSAANDKLAHDSAERLAAQVSERLAAAPLPPSPLSRPANPFSTPSSSYSNISQLAVVTPVTSSEASFSEAGPSNATRQRPGLVPLSPLSSNTPSAPMSPTGTTSFVGSRFIAHSASNASLAAPGLTHRPPLSSSASVSTGMSEDGLWARDVNRTILDFLPAEDLKSSSRQLHPRLKFKSRRIPQGYISEKPWINDRQHGDRILLIITIITCVIGCGIMGVLIWSGISSVTNYKYCLVMEDDFSSGTIDTDLWTQEVELGGFGNGEFEWTTSNSNNSYVEDGKLYIVPTLTSDVIGEDNLLNGYTVNLTSDGTCSSSTLSDCAISSNSSEDIMIPPIQSARLTSKASIKYGLVEVNARLPVGDWIWPAIWMLPTDNVYGSWPASGEIDIMESRGNDHNYEDGGYNYVTSTLHWGLDSDTDKYYKLHNSYKLRRDTYKKFHTYALEWSDKYLTIYVDGRLRQVIYHTFSESFWELGDFSTTFDNGTSIQDPWPANNNQAPFDQDFYLIMNVAVGGTNGFFADDVGDKPWTDGDRQIAMHSFWTNRESWESTWGDAEDRAMVVDYVRMYKICE
ncbi:concanavalin A-like lectin/glucanase domain-containing protein [Limtongia smithiae]|uniref:concanavalin A-like lectin/glucanase domain-containing protein n=1 Tax=Limtongia smithiae TaxID=1125753 RepID=UPI0034CDE4AB